MRSTARRGTAALALSLALALPACGDKIDPIEIETSGATTPVASVGTAAANTTTTGSSGTVSASGGSTGTNGTAASGLCGTSATAIGYSLYAAAVINDNCTSCHSPSGSQSNKPLNTFADAKATFTSYNGKYQVDSGAMPTTGPLNANDTCIIDAWVNGSYQP